MDDRNGIKLLRDGFFKGYNENVNPGTWIEMSTAAYRLHTLIQNWLPMKRTFNESFKPFHEFFFTPYYMYEPGALDNLVEGLAHENSQSFDNQITAEMTDHLFQAADEPFGLDIFALNIQRGRDHGLATYNDVREFCGLPRARNFKDLEDVMAPRSISSLARVYKHVDDIDFYAGGISENPVNRGDGLVGPCFACIMTGQFRDWRAGDRFWYENPGQFTPEQLNEIKKASLAGIICANTNVKQIQPRVFLDAVDSLNPRIDCANIPQMDMSKFIPTIPQCH
jgi:peroxidase